MSTKTSPRVTVLLSSYNRPELLGKAIESVLDQTFDDWELLILDDNSDDPRVLDLLQHFSGYPWLGGKHKVRILRSSIANEARKLTTRYATMINWGLQEAKGEFIAYLCDDDYFLANKLEKIVSFFDFTPQAMVVYGSQYIKQLTEDGRIVDFPTPVRKSIPIQNDASCQVDHSSVVMRRKVYEELGGWDDDPALWGSADAAYWKRINNAGYPFYGLEDILDVHLFHPGNWSMNNNLEKLWEKYQ